MKLVLNSITYHDCPVQVREKVAFSLERRMSMLRKMHAEEGISEALILETCNRLEFYLYVKKSFDSHRYITNLIGLGRPDAAATWREHSSETCGMEVVRHLFAVAAGLDSQMIGENQILSQVKAAYTESLNCRMSKLVFHRLFHNAFRVGKAVRTHTDINCGAVSIGLAAVELAKKRLKMTSTTAMVVGAGENAELVATYLMKAGLPRLILANRNLDNAAALAFRLRNTEVLPLDEIPHMLPEVDLVISSTSAEQPVVVRRSVESHLSVRNKPLLIVDIAVPRDIDPELSEFECVSLCNIDDLNTQININREKRSSQVPRARAIVDEFTEKFESWYDSLDLVPVIAGLTRRGLDLAHSEAARYAKDFGPNHEKLAEFAESLVRKVLHGPISFIKNGGDKELSTEQLEAIDLINRMFLSQDRGKG